MVIVANKKIQHGIAGATRHRLYNLVGIGRHAGVPDGDSVEGLQVMNEAQGPTFLLDAEPPGAVGGVRVFIHTGSALLLEEADDLVVDARWDGNIMVSPWDMLDNGDLDGRKILIAKLALLFLCPRKS